MMLVRIEFDMQSRARGTEFQHLGLKFDGAVQFTVESNKFRLH